MLVLTRKVGEDNELVIHVGTVTVQVFVLGIQSGKVRVGITAPPEAQIWRREVLERNETELERRHLPREEMQG